GQRALRYADTPPHARVGAGCVRRGAPARAGAETDSRRRAPGRAERGEEHAALRDFRRSPEDRGLPLHHARAAPRGSRLVGPPDVRHRRYSRHHRGRSPGKGVGPQVPAARGAHPAHRGARAGGQPRPAGDLRAAAAGGRVLLARARVEAAYRSTDQARPAPCSPLPGTVRDSFRAPRDPNDGRRTGRGGLIGDSRRAAGAHGNAVAGAAGRSRDEVAAYLALAQVPGIGAVRLPEDAAFPPLLSEVPDPPALLFAWGDTALLARPSAGIVGSRDHSPYGAAAARLLATGVAGAGVVVVSGMARGIDAIAHAAA